MVGNGLSAATSAVGAAQDAAQDAAQPMYHSTAFGLGWQSDLPLLPFTASTMAGHGNPVRVRTILESPPERVFGATQVNFQIGRNGFRYNALPEATLDSYDGDLVQIYPGPGYTGAPPAALFSTVAAILLAFRGFLPMHGSAVVQNGRATLVCGAAGMGKSTTVAHMIADGALLLSDDLSVLQANKAGGAPVAFAGRRSLRLHPETAAALSRAVRCDVASHPAQGKVAVYPPRADPHCAYPLARILLLGEPGTIAPTRVGGLLAKHLFRPGCLSLMDNHDRRIALLAIASRFIEITGAPPYDPHAIGRTAGIQAISA